MGFRINLPDDGFDVSPPGSRILTTPCLLDTYPPQPARQAYAALRPAASNCGALGLGVVRAHEKGTQENYTCPHYYSCFTFVSIEFHFLGAVNRSPQLRYRHPHR